MDIARPKSTHKFNYWWLGAAITSVLACAVYVAHAMTESADYKVDQGTLRFGIVERGTFDLVVRAPGTLIPTEIRWLTSDVSGRVERVFAKPGSRVIAGDIIAELSNPELQQQLEELRWDYEAQVAQNAADTKNLESNLLDQKVAELDAKIAYQSSEMSFKAQTQLRNSNRGSISLIDFQTLRMQTEQRQERWEIEQTRSANMQENVKAQIKAKKARLNKLKKQVARAEEQVERLNVRATMNSVVQEIIIEPGLQLSSGSNIAKLVQQDQLIAQLLVPEIQIKNVAIGQPVLIDTHSRTLRGTTERVSPSVIDGTVEVDVRFDEALPKDARPDLSIDGEIRVAQFDNALFVERPNFAQNFRQMRLFKVSHNGTFAQKTPVEFGQGSASKIEIVGGLSAGDKIIISDISDIEKFDSIQIAQ